MCFILKADVILANIFSNRERLSVDKSELLKYREKIKDELSNHNLDDKYIYFDLSEESLNNAVKQYRNYFIKIGNNIHRYDEVDVDYFNASLEDLISKTLKKVAQCSL